MKTDLVVGSLGDLAQKSGGSLAETFLNVDVVVLADTSGSMSSTDSRGGKSRYNILLEELAALQGNMPGKSAVISFSDLAIFCPNGKPEFFGGGTNLAKALTFAKLADFPGMRMFVISDGEPDDPKAALRVVGTYQARIDVIYVGPEERPYGRTFLEQLAAASGGQVVTADRAKELAASVERLLLNG